MMMTMFCFCGNGNKKTGRTQKITAVKATARESVKTTRTIFFKLNPQAVKNDEAEVAIINDRGLPGEFCQIKVLFPEARVN